MTGTLFERTLATAAIEAAFADAQIVVAMLAFEAALAEAEAEEGLVPGSAAAAIGVACRGVPFDIEAIVGEARRAGALAIPLVLQLKARVAAAAPEAAAFVHLGSTSQDVIDTAMVLVTKEALALIELDLDRLIAALASLAERHLETPMLGRTLLQAAEVVSFGHEVAAWLAPLVRCRERLGEDARAALQLQFGGAVGTLAALGERGPAVARRLGERLGLAVPVGAWHTQRDAWVTLGCGVAVLCGALGKIGRDLALLGQGEVGEVFEPREPGRGTSSAMPHKRNPVAAMVAIAAATRAPQQAATLLAAMPQAHQRGLGDWQAELAVWPSLFMAAHGAVRALADVCSAGLEVDALRMRDNIDAHFAAIGVAEGIRAKIDAAARGAGAAARAQLDALALPEGKPAP
ncbi:MAG: 3-carboxy-cis,cis-muconate cycloisomerase [Burkholderiales bacterium]|nr:3-carboxy-cis,cis-muconate cycloisomerase [Burkholderiales bacterium]